MKYSKTWIGIAVMAMLSMLPSPAADVKAEVELRAAVEQETVKGDLKSAIERYKKIVAAYPQNRSVAARALFHIGSCYEKLGQAEAQKAYERLVREYPDQKDMAAQAQSHLASLGGEHRDPASVTMRRVSDGREPDNEGRPSPDGQWLSYTSPEGDLGIYNLLTGEKRILKRNQPNPDGKRGWVEESIWSPDGKQIAYGWDYCGADCVELRVVQADGSGDRTLYRNDKLGYVFPFDWSPDGKYISATLYDSGREIALVDVRTAEARVLKAFPRNQEPGKVLFSPDGRYLAYDVEQPDSRNRDIWLLSLDGSQTALVENPADDYMLAWLPDGILFSSDRTGTMDVWRQAVTNGKPQGPPERLKAGIGNLQRALGLTRKGSLYYSVDTSTSDVLVAPMDPVTGKVVSRGVPVSQRHAGHYGSAAWSPDGKRLASLAQLDKKGPFQIITIRDMATGEERDLKPALPNLGNINWFNWGSINWTPDGRSLLVVSLSNDRNRGIFKIDAGTGEAVRLAAPETRPVNPQLTPDGKTLYYLENREPHPQVVAVDLASGNQRVALIVDDDGYWPRNFALSPDGEYVALPVDNWKTSRMLVAPAKGGASRVVHETKTEMMLQMSVAWSPDGRYVLFVERADAKSQDELWRVPVQGGQAEKLGLSVDGLHAPRVQPDGSRIVFNAGHVGMLGRSGGIEIWVLENFLPSVRASR